MAYAIYLRRSRADEEAEARGEGETLSRHRTALFSLARRLSLSIVEVYQEIASGDTISGRPEMRRLLADVAARKFDGVLCMAVDRLGRGDSMDQGYIMQTFLYSGTKIVTPEKTFDPQSPSDFEYFEMRQFFARREYASIKSRMQAGRDLATREGYYIASRPPYGYRIIQTPDRRSYTLEIVPDEAAIVRQIYSIYLYGLDGRETGCFAIASRLNTMQIPSPRGAMWSESTIRKLILNPIYAGRVTWNKRVQQIEMRDGQRIITRKTNPHPTIAQGHHEPLVSVEEWERAYAMMKTRFKGHTTPERQTAFLLSGLCKCGVCGKAMIRQANRTNPEYDVVKCSTPNCTNHGSYITTLEKLVLAQLEAWLVAVPEEQRTEQPSAEDLAAQIEKQLKALAAQHDRLHDFLEQGVYDVPTFLQRQRILVSKEEALRAQLAEIESAPVVSTEETIRRLAPRIRSVLDAYSSAESVAAKNLLLKSVVSRVVYTKPRRRYKNEPEFASISIDIFPQNF